MRRSTASSATQFQNAPSMSTGLPHSSMAWRGGASRTRPTSASPSDQPQARVHDPRCKRQLSRTRSSPRNTQSPTSTELTVNLGSGSTGTSTGREPPTNAQPPHHRLSFCTWQQSSRPLNREGIIRQPIPVYDELVRPCTDEVAAELTLTPLGGITNQRRRPTRSHLGPPSRMTSCNKGSAAWTWTSSPTQQQLPRRSRQQAHRGSTHHHKNIRRRLGMGRGSAPHQGRGRGGPEWTSQPPSGRRSKPADGRALDGQPQIWMAWIGLDGEEVVIGTMFDQAKLRDIGPTNGDCATSGRVVLPRYIAYTPVKRSGRGGRRPSSTWRERVGPSRSLPNPNPRPAGRSGSPSTRSQAATMGPNLTS